MSDIEMNTYEGVCRYCGNIQPVMAMDQVDANEKISEECSCGEQNWKNGRSASCRTYRKRWERML